MELSDCVYSPHRKEFKDPCGAGVCGSPVRFCIRPGRGFAVSRASLVIRREQKEPLLIDMDYQGIERLCDVFCCSFTPPDAGLYFYRFEIETSFGRQSICPAGQGRGEITASVAGFWQLTVSARGFETPDWLKGGIIYQVFPDRFNRVGEEPEDLPEGRVMHQKWGELPEYRPDPKGEVRNNDYFGGNLRGIAEKLPYLQSLGVTAIYLNPIFEAHSNHRYNTADYMKIDPLLGSEEDFRALCRSAARRGIGVILDGVFNHTGDDSVYFNRCGRYRTLGAYQSKDSPYFGWYRFKNWPDSYNCWWGFKTLPEVNEDDASLQQYITGPGGVIDHWLGAGASGFRLDVADELPDPFIQKIRAAVKSANPQALLVGEVWEDASNKISYGSRRHYLEGDELDSVMNYPFRDAIIGFLRGGASAQLNETVLTILDHYPQCSVNVLMNLLGTHDTIRIITALAGDSPAGMTQENKARSSLAPAQRDRGVRLVCLAAALQYFLPGVPCVYYGDETGLEGYQDPFNRRCYPWGRQDQTLLGWYKLIGRIRRACPALVSGGYRCVQAQGSLYVFERRKGEDTLYCAVNAGDAACSLQLPTDAARPALLASAPGRQGGMPMLPPLSCRVYGAGKWVRNIRP